jgi:hypothetical protein
MLTLAGITACSVLRFVINRINLLKTSTIYPCIIFVDAQQYKLFCTILGYFGLFVPILRHFVLFLPFSPYLPLFTSIFLFCPYLAPILLYCFLFSGT